MNDKWSSFRYFLNVDLWFYEMQIRNTWNDINAKNFSSLEISLLIFPPLIQFATHIPMFKRLIYNSKKNFTLYFIMLDCFTSFLKKCYLTISILSKNLETYDNFKKIFEWVIVYMLYATYKNHANIVYSYIIYFLVHMFNIPKKLK